MTEASDPQANLVRADGRTADELRTVTFERGWSAHAEGSALVSFGSTKVLCTASFTNGVPRWMTGKGRGWVTAEYAMLPRATNTRNDRESVKGRIGGRTHEITRLIGRSLRAVVDTKALGENTIQIDCDVLQADGGTRTAAITGAYVALADAIEWGRAKKFIGQKAKPLIDTVSAVSVGIIDGTPMLDLAYVEDVRAETDMNVVATGRGLFVEVQGTAEGAPFDRASSTRCSTSRSPAPPSSRGCRSAGARRRRRGGRRVTLGVRARDPQRAQGARVPAHHRRADAAGRRAAVRRPRTGRGGRDLRRERVHQGAHGGGAHRTPRSPTTRASPSTCSAALPASSPPGGRGRRRDEANVRLLLDQLSDIRRPHRGAEFHCTIALVVPDTVLAGGHEFVAEGAGAAPSPTSRAVRTGSATTPSSSPMASRSPRPSCRPRRRTPGATAPWRSSGYCPNSSGSPRASAAERPERSHHAPSATKASPRMTLPGR